MKTLLQNLLISFALALCALIAFQWIRETDLRKTVQELTDTVHDRMEEIQGLQANVRSDKAEIQRLDGLKNQLSETIKSNAVALADLNKRVEQATNEIERSKKQVEAYKDAVERANENIKAQNENVKKQNEEMAKLAEDRNEVVKKFNKMAADYNDLASKWNKQQEELVKAATNRAGQEAVAGELLTFLGSGLPERPRMKNIVYFDLETQKSADEVGGWGHISKMGMSIGVLYSTAQGEYRIYGESRVNDLIKDLQRADLVVGFNNLRFDYEVLHGYTTLDLRQLPTLDMLVDVQATLQHRLSLDSIATATFGVEKTAEGMQAIQWFKEGKLLDIAEYCCYDVKITRMVHEYGVQHHQLHYQNRFGKKLSVPVKWQA